MRKLPLGVISVVVAVITAACAADLPSSPAPTPLPTAGTPATLELAITPGIGDQGGTAAIGVRVLDAFGAPVVNLAVALTSTAGTISPDQITTDGAGRGTAVLQAAPGSVTVTASIANGPTRSAPVAVQPLPPPLPTPTPTPPNPPAPEPPRPPLTVTIFVTPQAAGQTTTFSLATQAIASATWDFGDSATLTTTIPFASHVYGAAGSYPVTVIVRDTQGRTASTSTTVTITAAPAPPPPSAQAMAITFKANATSVASGGTLTYTASIDNLLSGETVTAYQWDLDGSGTAEFTTTTPSKTSNPYTTAGIVTPRVTITTNQRVGSATTTIVVTN